MFGYLQLGKGRVPYLVISLFVVALASASTGCGGGSQTSRVGANLKASDFRKPPPHEFTRAELRQRLDSVCARVTKQFAELKGPPANVGAMKAIDAMARYGFEHLHTRPGVRAAYSSFLAKLKYRDEMLAGVLTRSPRKEHLYYLRKYRVAEARANAAARRLRLRHCPYN